MTMEHHDSAVAQEAEQHNNGTSYSQNVVTGSSIKVKYEWAEKHNCEVVE